MGMGRRVAWGGGLHGDGEEGCMGRRAAWGGGLHGEETANGMVQDIFSLGEESFKARDVKKNQCKQLVL